ncbi:AAC(3) family N-acetyltransferase [Gemmiger sp.]|uniref:AAC(3) family N-acetyltransferase n=1 Tax=Gemmiger sp. TaxID=2049027 RepID=UPI003AB882A3
MPYTRSDLLQDLAAMGLTGQETILIHSSMRSIGAVEGGADTVLDALTAFFANGLLLLPVPECIVTAPGIPSERWQ